LVVTGGAAIIALSRRASRLRFARGGVPCESFPLQRLYPAVAWFSAALPVPFLRLHSQHGEKTLNLHFDRVLARACVLEREVLADTFFAESEWATG